MHTCNVSNQDLDALAQQIVRQDAAEKLKRVEAAAQRVQKLQVVLATHLETLTTTAHPQEQQAALEQALEQAARGEAVDALAAYEARMGETDVAAARAQVEAAEMAVLQARMERAQLAEQADKVYFL